MTLAHRKRKYAKLVKNLRRTLALEPEVSVCVWVRSTYKWAVICMKKPMVNPTNGKITEIASFLPVEIEPGYIDSIIPLTIPAKEWTGFVDDDL
jgi:hypothetical protein